MDHLQDIADTTPRKRTVLPYVEHREQSKFELPTGKSRTYGSQFFRMYTHRSASLIPRVLDQAEAKWGKGDKKVGTQHIVHQGKILDIISGQLCWVVGTVFVEMKGKLNILDDVEKGVDDVLPKAPLVYGNFDSEAVVMLEDESGRAILAGDYLRKANLVTGCVVGVLGMEVKAGIFEVMDVVFPKRVEDKQVLMTEDASTTSASNVSNPTSASAVAFVSGLGVGENADNLKLDLLKEYLIGELGAVDTPKQISRVVILGDSIKSLPVQPDVSTATFGSKNIITYDPRSLVQFDLWLGELALSIPVLVMPGSNDPAEICLPQQPLHRSMFRSSLPILQDGRVVRLTNPLWIQEGPTSILCTAGQNVDDIKKYTGNTLSSVEVMKRHLEWQHIAPTAPDTLYCYAYTDHDPFILESVPQLYVSGNQDSYGTQVHEGTTLLSVPRFSDKGEFVLYWNTGESEVVSIA